MEWGDVAEWAAVLAAVGIAIWSRLRAGRAAKNADEARDRSTRALEIAAAAQDRLAALAEAEAARYQMPWQVEPAGQHKFHLVNTGDEVEHDVSIHGNTVTGAPVTRQRVGPREAVEFFAAPSVAETDYTITVYWYRHPAQGGDRLEWRYPLAF